MFIYTHVSEQFRNSPCVLSLKIPPPGSCCSLPTVAICLCCLPSPLGYHLNVFGIQTLKLALAHYT